MKIFRREFVCVAAALAVLFAWMPLSAADQKGTLIVALESLGGQSMDPIMEGRPTNAHIQAPVFDSLLGYDYEKGGVGPGVATRWVLSDDGLSWTFHLRKDVKWHNGDPLTAHDVKFSLERTMSKDSRSSRRSQLRRNVVKIEVVDNHTVRIFTKGVQVHFPSGLSRSVFQEGQLMPKKYIEKVGEKEFGKKPIGSGPWKFVRSVPGDLIEYEAVDYPHWRGMPKYKKLLILLVPEESTRVSMVRTGEAAIASISPEAIQEAKAGKLKVMSVPATMQAIYQFWGLYQPQFKNSPLADVRVREALSLAIDRQAIIDHVMYGQASWPMPFASFGYSVDMDAKRWKRWSRDALRYDPKRAKQLLAEAGYPNGFEMNFANTALPGTPYMVQIGVAVADFWNKIGVKVKLTNYEWGAFRTLNRGDQKKLAGGASMFRTAGRPVAMSRYNVAFATKSPHRLYGNADICPDICQAYKKLYAKQVTQQNPVKRAAMTDAIMGLVADSWVAVPILEGMGYWAINPKLVGSFKPIPGRHEFGDVFERIPRPDQKSW
jgi:ABC-type transport system substrate-binding protein